MRKRDKAIEKTETPNELPTSFFQVFFLLGIFTTWLCITADSCLEKQHNKNDDGNKNQAPRNMDEKRRIESRCETIVISLHPTFYTHTHKPTCIWVHLILHAAFLVSKEIQHISLTCTHTHTSNELRIEKQNKNLEFSSKHLSIHTRFQVAGEVSVAHTNRSVHIQSSLVYFSFGWWSALRKSNLLVGKRSQ